MPLHQPPKHDPQATAGKPLMPAWVAVLLVLATLLAGSAYFSPDMRAVFAAAWAACF